MMTKDNDLLSFINESKDPGLDHNKLVEVRSHRQHTMLRELKIQANPHTCTLQVTYVLLRYESE